MSKLESKWSELQSILTGWRKTSGGHVVRCPAHNDKQASLSVGRGKEGRIIFNCHAGCETIDILDAIGWSWNDVLPDRERRKRTNAIVKEFNYTDETGRLLYQVCRYEDGSPAKFKPRHQVQDAKGNLKWKQGIGPSGPMIYRLPEVLEAKRQKLPIIIVEGEKDADNLLALGLPCATCNPGGAKGWREHFSTYFQDGNIFVCGDNDAAGRSFVASVVRNVRPIAKSLRIIRLPFTKKAEDVSDWIQSGGTRESFLDYMRGAKKIAKTDVADLAMLTKKAFQLRQAGKDAKEILETLDNLNFQQLVPASSDDVKKIAKQAATKEKGMAPLARKSELTIARHVLEEMGPDLIFTESEFYKYEHKESGVWSSIHTSEVAKKINSLEGRLYVASSKDGVEEYKQLTINASTTRGALSLLEFESSSPDFFDEAPPIVVTQNGSLRVDESTVEFTEHSKEHRQRFSLPFSYDANAICPRFDAFLREVVPDVPEHNDRQCAKVLQEFVGVALFGMSTRYQSCLMLYGSGSNGKSVFMDVVRSLFPRDAVASVSPQSFDDDYHCAHLAGKLVNICAETPSIEITRTDRFKAVISGDPIVARLPYRQPWTMRPRAGMIFAANELPMTRDSTPGFWRRFLPIPFTQQISDARKDPTLARKIIETELPGVLAWAIRGAQAVMSKKGYTVPMASEELKLEWLGESDSVSAFATDIIVQDKNGWVFDAFGISARTLYERYSEWCKSNHHKPVSVTKFGRRMASLGIERKKEKAGRFYKIDADTNWKSVYDYNVRKEDTWHNQH